MTNDELRKHFDLDEEDVVVNFGFLPMPDGYIVIWSSGTEHYMALGPGSEEGYIWEGSISVDRYWCRRQAIWHSNQAKGKS